LEKAISWLPLFGEAATDAAESENLCMRGHPKRENRESLLVSAWHGGMLPAKGNDQKTLPTVLLI
jgi:hypothetical protein